MNMLHADLTTTEPSQHWQDAVSAAVVSANKVSSMTDQTISMCIVNRVTIKLTMHHSHNFLNNKMQ